MAYPEETIERISKILREEEIPYFVDGDIEFYLNENNGDVNKTLYQMLVLKSESSQIYISGLSTQDTSKYFLRLALKYRGSNTGTLKG